MRFVFCIMILLCLTSCFSEYNYVSIDHQRNFIEKSNSIVVPNYVLEYKIGDGYITVTRLKTKAYRCQIGVSEPYVLDLITDMKQYIAINTVTHKIYKTENREEYLQYLSEKNIYDLHTSDRFDDAYFIKNEVLREADERLRSGLEKRVLAGQCKPVTTDLL